MKRIFVVLLVGVLMSASFILVTRSLAAANQRSSINEQPDLGAINWVHKTGATQDAVIGNASSVKTDAQLETLLKQIELAEYQVTWQTSTYLDEIPAAYHAPNRAHDLRTYFDPHGIHVMRRTDSENSWLLSLSVDRFGSPGNLRPALTPQLTSTQNQVVLQRGELDEWYTNTPAGLEQEFTIQQPLDEKPETLLIEMSLQGDLHPNLSPDGSEIVFSTSAGRQVLRYSGLYAHDAEDNPLPAGMQIIDTSSGKTLIQLRVDVSEAVYPVTIDPTIEGLSEDYSQKIENSQLGSQFGFSVGAAGDLNKDGFDDVIIGAPQYDNGQEDEGRAFVYIGSSDGLVTLPVWTAEVDQADAGFGYSVGSAGDVNNDGWLDVIVGADFYQDTVEVEGGAFVFHGSEAGLSETPDWVTTGGVIVGRYGASVSTAGDLNNDGYDDVIVGAPDSDFTGRVYAYYGSSSGLSETASWTTTDPSGSELTQKFGISVSKAGNVNGDSYDDVIVGCAVCSDYAGGAAFLYLGSADTSAPNLGWTDGLSQANAGFGSAVGYAGDVNDDGYSDIIVGAPDYDNDTIADVGMANVYHGSSTGPSTAADWTVEGDIEMARLGNAVGTAGDVNGDGYDDTVVGSYTYNGYGRVYLYQGTEDGLGMIETWFADGEYQGSNFGNSVGTAGDIDNDGLSDVIVGASGNYAASEPFGAIYIYFGLPDLFAINDSPTALGNTTRLTATLTLGGDYLFEWDLGDDTTASGAVVEHTYPAVGEYTAVVTATEGERTFSTDTNVIVEEVIDGLAADNDSPTALGDTTTFSATVTAGTNPSFEWDFGDEGTGSGTNPTHAYASAGSYTASVTATNGVSTQTATTMVTVEEVIAGLAADNDSPTALGDTTTFSATVTTGTDPSYEWDFGDGGTSSGANPTHAYASVGSYTATVTATNDVSSQTATTMVTIDEAIAGLVADNDSPTALGDTTTFSATLTAGTDPLFEWDFGDGGTGSGVNPTHTYASAGSYTATVTATNDVSSQTATTMVAIGDAIAGLTADNDSPTALGDTTTFSATITTGTDPSYEWDFGDGSTGSGANPTHIYPAVGSYTATVTATNDVSSQTATTMVTIEEAIAGLTAENDSPTFIGNFTTLSASITAGSNVTFEWDFGDGSAKEQGAVVTHKYPQAQSYLAQVTAKNGVSADSATTIVVVKFYQNFLPVVFYSN